MQIGSVISNIGRAGRGLGAIAGKRVLATLTGVDATQLKDILDTANTQPSLCFVPIQTESITKRRRTDVSNTMLISQVTQEKTYVTDNSAPHPRTWNIRGYIKALTPVLENHLLIKPTLLAQEAILDAASESRQTVKLKTDMGEIVDVLIQDLAIGGTPKGQNVRTIDVTVQEVKVLQNSVAETLGLDSVGSASIAVNAFKNLGKNIAITAGIASTSALLMNINIPAPEVVEDRFEIDLDSDTVAKPVFSTTERNVDINTRISLTCDTDDAVILYTTDGTEPEVGGTAYSEPIIIDRNMIIKAKAFKSGLKDSATAYAKFTVNQDVPGELTGALTTVPSGEVTAGTAVKIYTDDVGAILVYTTDGSTPDYSSKVAANGEKQFVITGDTVIKAMTVKSGSVSSDVETFEYTVAL